MRDARQPISIRLTAEQIALADYIAEKDAARRVAGKVSRSDVLRSALERGLAEMKREVEAL